MTSKRDYIMMAGWISEHTSPDPEWSHVRDPLIALVCFIAAESDKTRGNQKRFDKKLFLKAIDRFDKEGKTENEPL